MKFQWTMTPEARSAAVEKLLPAVNWFVSKRMRPETIRMLGGRDDAFQACVVEAFRAVEDAKRLGRKPSAILFSRLRFRSQRMAAEAALLNKPAARDMRALKPASMAKAQAKVQFVAVDSPASDCPVDEAAKRERRQLIDDAIGRRLTARQAACVRGEFFEHKSHQEIADGDGTSRQAVYAAVVNGLERLRRVAVLECV